MLVKRRIERIHSLKPSDLTNTIDDQMIYDDLNSPTETLGVLCINCGNYVFFQDIEGHSSQCVRVQESELETEYSVKQVCVKLDKFEAFLLKSLELFHKAGDRNYLSILTRLCKKLKTAVSPETLDANAQVAESLASLLATFRGTEALRLYGERLKALTKEQEREIATISRKTELDSLKEQVEYYKSKAITLEKSIVSGQTLLETNDTRHRIDQLDSDVGSRPSESSEFSGSSSSFSDVVSSRDTSYEVDSKSKNVSADLKRYFYSHCLAIKLTFPQNSAAHSVPISTMFKYVIDNRIPVDNWNEVIKARLSKARLSARASHAPSSRRKLMMDTLTEDSREEESDKEEP